MTNGIIAGHGRIMAFKTRKMDEVPTITQSGFGDTEEGLHYC